MDRIELFQSGNREKWLKSNCYRCGYYSRKKHERDRPQECPVFVEVWSGEVSAETAIKIGQAEQADVKKHLGDWSCKLKISRIKKNREDKKAYDKVQAKLDL